MKSSSRLVAVLTLLALAGATPAMAHPGHSAGFTSGWEHPFTGWDHLLAMVAVGIWAVQLGGRAIWQLPLAFASFMAVGGVVGWLGIRAPGVEVGIVLSVIALGLLIATATRMNRRHGLALLALFAVCHGYAHGVEMAPGTAAAAFGAGFVVSTLALHGLGVALGLIGQRLLEGKVLRLAGAAIAVSGVALAFLPKL